MELFNERYLPLIEKSGKAENELEKAIGLPRSIIYDWKNGRNKSYKKYADKIAVYFNVDVNYLLGITETPMSDSTLNYPPDVQSLWERYSSLTEEQKIIVDGMIDQLLKK